MAGGVSVGDRHVVSGILDVKVRPHISSAPVQIPVRVEFSSTWPMILPLLFLNSMPSWVRTGAEWHVAINGGVCLEWHERWADHLDLLGTNTDADIADVAAQWITRSAAHTLHVHFTCHVRGRLRWPKSVPFWAHDGGAHVQYEREKLQQKSKSKR